MTMMPVARSTSALAPALLLALALAPSDCLLQVWTAPTAVRLPLHRSPIEPWRRRRTTSPTTSRRSSSPPLTALHLLKGLVPQVDDDIRRETADANISSWELFQRELDGGASVFGALSAVRRRRKDRAGDYENKYKILSDYRSYGNKELLDTDHFDVEPRLDDLNQKQPETNKIFWVTIPFRLGVLACAYTLFPLLCYLLDNLVQVTPDEFDIINDQFTPGIGILYGTFVALTLDILYERQGKVQENASVEASLLSQVTQNVICLFRDENEIGREAMQIIADQVRIIVYRSRGSEMLSIMRSDPYARLLSIVDHYQRDKESFTPQQEALIDGLRAEIPSLMEARAKRLSDEASALPPTHFIVLLVLTTLSLLSFTAATLTITDADGNPPLESRMVFAALSAVYVLFYNFCSDMNDPFDGVYQIKRSSAAAYLMQIKWLIANQPYGEYIMFDTRGLAPVYDGNEVNEMDKSASKLEPPPSSELSPKSLKAVADTNEESESQESAISAKTSSPELSHAVESPESKSSAKAFLPELKKTLSDASVQVQSAPLHEELVSQFESLGGFSGEKMNGEGVTVPSKTKQNEPVDRKKISMYFRKTGGFGG
eukprot:CAMPEP_0172532654 /NCGR_PEP_ID=MMETSP1067-20121228/5627_1 /TAXON_ID=265564 ORGANISM="Thalassiosira punctigera, Strain Tpunct2005C2" /NCGR_SAMPLE_ID=MMETSP1067 /ASSEMBLY_ACC=CAM_ASM_000444 /LENGTH=601 /DNA_ID=CAMNT_0013317195 /DNA_START=30 /DNA_END=1835 /DNA_ORIENTATION=-